MSCTAASSSGFRWWSSTARLSPSSARRRRAAREARYLVPLTREALVNAGVSSLWVGGWLRSGPNLFPRQVDSIGLRWTADHPARIEPPDQHEGGLTDDELTDRIIELFPPLAEVKPWDWNETED